MSYQRQMTILTAIQDAIWAQESGDLEVYHLEPDPNPDAPDDTRGKLLVDGTLDLARVAEAISAALEEPKP